MISSRIFLKILAKKDLLPSEAIHKLKRQIEESAEPIPAEAVAKRLIKKGYLTEPLAKRLLKAAASAEKKLNDEAAGVTRIDELARPEESTLGFAPLAAKPKDDDEPVVSNWEMELEELVPTPPVTKPGAEKKPTPAEKKSSAAAPPAAKPKADLAAPKASRPEPAVVEGEAADGDVVEGEVIAGEVVEGDVMPDAPAERVKPRRGRQGVEIEEDGGARLSTKRRKGLAGLMDRIIPGRDRARKENPWDSSLMLTGGGVLLLLVLCFGGLIWLLTGESGDKMLEEATKFYRQGAYTKAIAQYDKFINDYPAHKGASLAKVQRGLAQLRQAVEMTKDQSKSLEVAKDVLGKIRSETAFPEAKAELKSLLETIAKGLSEQARRDTDPKLVAQTREAVKLVEANVFKSKRNKALMDDIATSLELTERAIARDSELAKAVKSMDELIAEGKSEQAYGVRRALLKSYPDLLDNKPLRAAVLRVCDAQQAAVKMVEQPKAADVPGPDDAEGTSVAMAQRHARRDAPGAKGSVVCALAEGAAYGLDATTGRVLWRRSVGFGSDGARLGFAPMPVDGAPGSDVLMVDARAQALVRVEATTGRVRWRQVIGEPFDAQPVLDSAGRALVATSSGRLVIVDLASGNSPGFIQIPQQLTSAPAIDRQSGHLYQVAEHSNLYVLSPEGKCEKVVYLAHEPGTVIAAPVVISRLLVVGENRGARNAVLRILSLEAQKKVPSLTQIQEIDIEGHVDAPPLVAGARMLATTDSGRVVAYRVSGAEGKEPIEKVAQLQTSDEPNLIRFPLLLGDHFFVADKTLTDYRLQSSLGSFRTEWTAFPDSAFLQPLTAIGRTVFFVRRRLNLPGVQVAAVALDDPNPLWATDLAVPLADEPVVTRSGSIEVVTALGSLIEVPPDTLKTRAILDQPVVSLRTEELRRAVQNVVRTSDGSVVLASGAGSDRLSVFDPKRSPRQFRPVLVNPLGASPAPMADGLLVPCQLGEVDLIAPRTGLALADPFQVKLAAGRQVAWRRPAAVDANTVVLSDGRERIYLLAIKDQPKPHLAAAAKATLAAPIDSDVAVLGNLVCAADENGQLVRLRLPDLAAGEPLPLGGRVTWGPRAVGEHFFLTTENDQLLCLDGKGDLAWRVALLHGPLAGPPLPAGGDFLLAHASGVLARVEGGSGREVARIETGNPLGAGPIPLDEKVLLVGSDGTLYVSEFPSESK